MRPPALLLFAATLGVCADDARTAALDKARAELRQMWSGRKTEGEGGVRLTRFPLDIADLGEAHPMGVQVGGHVLPSSHAGLRAKDSDTPKDRYAVHAPADGFLVQVQHRVALAGTTEKARAYDDWRLVFEHSRTIYTYIDLIRVLEPDLAKVVGAMEKGGTAQVRIAVKAGQVVGRMGGDRGLDFGAVDLASEAKGFAHVEDYAVSEAWRLFCVDPYAMYDEPLRAQILAHDARTAEPRGGEVACDVEGTVQGGWFLEGTGFYAGKGDPRGYWMGHLHIGHHYVAADRLLVAIGDCEGKPTQFGVKGDAPDPAQVGVESGAVKFELIMAVRPSGNDPFAGSDGRVVGVMLVQLVDARKLRVEVFAGKTAAEVKEFTSAARVYER